MKIIVGSAMIDAEKDVPGPLVVEIASGGCWIRLRNVETVPETGAL